MRNSPHVNVTGPNKRLRFAWWATRFALWINGIEAHDITTKRQLLPGSVQGVVIGGGDDIEPEHYGLSPLCQDRWRRSLRPRSRWRSCAVHWRGRCLLWGTVDVVDTSHLKEILGTRALLVNSLHNQAVDRVAEGLRAPPRWLYSSHKE